MGTHPIFESDFDCLTEMSNVNESYIREHKLKQLMEFLMEQLLNKKPSNPEKYLIKILERRQSLLSEKPKTPTKRPTESLSSPRARTYEKPWLSNSTNLHSSMPKKKTSRPLSSTQPTSDIRPLSKTVDLTVSSNEHERRSAAKNNFKKISKNDDVMKEAIQKTTMKVLNAAKETGKPPIKSDLHNEELKLEKYEIEKTKSKKEIDTKAQMELQRQKKGMKTKKKIHSIPEPPQKPKKQISVAYEQPGPKEVAILENPFDLAAEGIKVSNAELQAASKMNFKNVKVDMDAMINKLAQNPTQQRIDSFLNETNHDYMSPPMSHRSYVSVSGLETREWKMIE